MTFRPAYEEFTLEHGGNTVTLRPSLRAASYLEARYGFATLFRHVDEFNLTTIREIILAASPSRQDAAAFLSSLAGKPLSLIAGIVSAPVADLCRAFVPAPVQQSDTPITGMPMPWPEVYRELYRTATGWLHWTPAEAWAATPTEINEAFAGHVAMLKAIHGTGDEKPTPKQIDPIQAARNVADGLDPEFDREGLRALKAKITSA